MKRYKIDSELRKIIIQKYKEYTRRERNYNGAHSTEWLLLHTYSYSSTIREDLFQELKKILA